MKNTHQSNLSANGMNSETSVRSGLAYADALLTVKRFIEAERLLTKVSAESRRVHGPQHNITLSAEVLEC